MLDTAISSLPPQTEPQTETTEYQSYQPHDEDAWPLVPLSKGHFRAWADQYGPNAAGLASTLHACPVSNALREVCGWEDARTDYNPEYGFGWAIHAGQVYRLPQWAYELCLMMDRSRARPTGVRLVNWVDRTYVLPS